MNPFWSYESFCLKLFGAPQWEPTIANYVTVGRARLGYFVVPVLYTLSLSKDINYLLNWAMVAAFAVFLIAAFGDILDGFLARRFGKSDFGKIFDPMADGGLIFFALTIVSFDNGHAPHYLIPDFCLTVAGIMVLKRRVGDLKIETPATAKGKQFVAAAAVGTLFGSMAFSALCKLGYTQCWGLSLEEIAQTAHTAGLTMLWVATPLAAYTIYTYCRLERQQL